MRDKTDIEGILIVTYISKDSDVAVWEKIASAASREGEVSPVCGLPLGPEQLPE